MRVRRLIPVIVLLGLALGGLFLLLKDQRNADPDGLKSITVRLPIPAVDMAFAPYYVAEDFGFFEKHGLAVTLEPGTTELNPIAMVGTGQDDFGVLGGPELLFSARQRGIPLVAILQLHKDSDFVVLLALEDSGITAVQDLDGKKVGFFYGHISEDILRMTFAKEGVQVEEIDVGFDYGPLLTGQVDAQWAFRTTAGISLRNKGLRLATISPLEAGLKTQGHIIVAHEDTIENDPQLAQDFIAAVLDALAYSLANEDEAIAAALSRDPNFLRQTAEEQNAIYNKTILRNVGLGCMSTDDMSATATQMQEASLLPPSFDPDEAYTNRFIIGAAGKADNPCVAPSETGNGGILQSALNAFASWISARDIGFTISDARAGERDFDQ